MRKTLIFIFLVGITSQLQAQQLSAGYRTGINNWVKINTTHNGAFIQEVKDGAKISWNNEIFMRYQTKGKLAFEGGISHTKRDKDEVAYIIGCWGDRDSRVEDINISYTALNMGLQYKINTPGIMKCPLLDRLSNYAGISFSPILANNVTEHRFTSYDIASTMQQQPTRHNSKYITLSAGINHTLIYQVNKYINIHSKVGIDYIYTGIDNFKANTRIGANLGVSYNIR